MNIPVVSFVFILMLTLIVLFNVVPFVTWIISRLHNINLVYFMLIDDYFMSLNSRKAARWHSAFLNQASQTKNEHDLAVNS